VLVCQESGLAGVNSIEPLAKVSGANRLLSEPAKYLVYGAYLIAQQANLKHSPR
jgi:hypothetical protein